MFPHSVYNHFLSISMKSMVLVDSESRQMKPTAAARRRDNAIFEFNKKTVKCKII